MPTSWQWAVPGGACDNLAPGLESLAPSRSAQSPPDVDAVRRGPAAFGAPVPLKSIRDPNTLICDGFRRPLQRSPGSHS